MLFSRADVANQINRLFEPTWESVRPVPQVTIDFGNGKVVRRTLHGNIATYVCNADGQVFDILPGIYAPKEYTARLGQLWLLYRYVEQAPAAARAKTLHSYHAALLAALKKNQPGPVLIMTAGVTKRNIEGRTKIILAAAPPSAGERNAGDKAPRPPGGQDLAEWKLLVRDTQINESSRRRLVHEMLLERDAVRPADITRRLYRDVLHTDIDDPYLGLSKVLFGGYPFKE